MNAYAGSRGSFAPLSDELDPPGPAGGAIGSFSAPTQEAA
jgi:hypothetical protein